MEKDYSVPMSSHIDKIKDKSNDYRLVGLMTLNSKFNPKDEKGERYMYKTKETLDLLAKELQVTGRTARAKLSKMTKSESGLITIEQAATEIVYKINYATEGKYYVRINHRMLKTLVKAYSSETLKTYVTLLWVLENGEKQITLDWLGAKLGLANEKTGKVSNGSKDGLTIILRALQQGGFIHRTPVETQVLSRSGKVVNTTVYKYRLATIEEWETAQRSADKGKV